MCFQIAVFALQLIFNKNQKYALRIEIIIFNIYLFGMLRINKICYLLVNLQKNKQKIICQVIKQVNYIFIKSIYIIQFNLVMKSTSTQQKKLRNQKQTSDNQYTCKCGKKYKSYAAVYTHIRNKHSSSDKYFKQIQRPAWNKQQKGRPKIYKKLIIKAEDLRNQVIQCGLYDICQKLEKNNITNVLLTQNKQFNLDQTKFAYQELCQLYGTPPLSLLQNLQILDSEQQKLRQFYLQITKHLNSQTAARILWTLNRTLIDTNQFLIYDENTLNNIQFNQSEEIINKIWLGIKEMDKQIKKIYQNWCNISADQQQKQTLNE